MAATLAPKKSLTLTEIYTQLSETIGLSKTQTRSLMLAVIDLAYTQAKNGFQFPGIGKLVLATSSPRNMVMRFGPDTGKTKKIPAKTRIKFRVSKQAKDAILGSDR